MTEKELEMIYNEAYRAVYWTAMSLLKNEEEAEDIVQDTFVTLIESYDTIKDKSKVVPWLKKIAANKSLNRLTRSKTVAVEDEFFEGVEDVSEDFLPDSLVESAETRKIIMDIIERTLSQEIRTTLILFYFDEMSTREIAQILGVPEGTVRRRLNFARNRIKKEVEKYEKENDTKLFGMAALPFLSKLFMKEAEQVPFKTMPASLTTALSASANAITNGAGQAASVAAKGAGRKAASAAAKGTGIMMNKLLIGGIATVVLAGTVTAGIHYFNSQKKDDPRNEQNAIENVVPTGTEDDFEQKHPSDATVVSDTEPSDDAPSASGSRDGIDPDAAVLLGTPVMNGHAINLPCTIGELKSYGFDFDEVIDEESVMMKYDQPDDYCAFTCHLQDPLPNTDSVSDDTVVIAIELFIIGTDLDFHGLELGMYETEFKAALGTPAYTAGRTVDHGKYYYYLGLGDVVYEFYCSELVVDPTKPQLVTFQFGTAEYMYKKTRLADVI